MCHKEINIKTCASSLQYHLKQYEGKSEKSRNKVEQLKNNKKNQFIKSLGTSKKESLEVVK